MKEVLAVLLAIMFMIGSASAIFEENVGVQDDAQASIDRPLINHIKAFTNEYLPPVYKLITGIEDILGS